MTKTLSIALFSIALSVAAQFLLKSGMSSVRAEQGLLALATNLRIIGGFALYGLGAIAWLSVLRAWDVSKAYPLVGLGFAATTVIGYLLGEHVTPLRTLGTLLVCVGIVMISKS